MLLRPYQATVSVGGRDFTVVIKLSPDEYCKFLNREFNATHHVIALIREQDPMLGYATFTERDFQLTPLTSAHTDHSS